MESGTSGIQSRVSIAKRAVKMRVVSEPAVKQKEPHDETGHSTIYPARKLTQNAQHNSGLSTAYTHKQLGCPASSYTDTATQPSERGQQEPSRHLKLLTSIRMVEVALLILQRTWHGSPAQIPDDRYSC